MKSNGFSLMELLIVVAIMGIIAALPVALMSSSTQKPDLKIQSSTVVQALTQARDFAVSHANCVKVTINAGQSISVDAFAPLAGACDGTLGAATNSLPPFVLAPGFTLSDFLSGGNSILFNTQGGLTVNTTMQLSLTDSHSNKVNIRILPAIGQVRVSGN